MVINHYQLLGISPDAGSREIKVAYRGMAKRCHPDTNQGSEAAAELFRQLNEAYRILSDKKLRKLYDRKLELQAQVKPRKKTNPQTADTSRHSSSATRREKTVDSRDPQQKFSRFLNSLLDAIFESPTQTDKDQPNSQPTAEWNRARKPRRKPDFNFYYYLAMERNGSPYSCGEDGIYRRKQRGQGKRSFGGVTGNSVIFVLMAGLWEFIKN